MKEYKVGDTVNVGGYTSFCHPYTSKVKNILTKYDADTGKPYPVYVLADGDKYDGRDGSAITGATMYFIDDGGDNETASCEDDEQDEIFGRLNANW